MKSDKTRITIRIEKDLLTEFGKIFPYRGELTAFILRCMSDVCNREKYDFDIGQIKKHIVKER